MDVRSATDTAILQRDDCDVTTTNRAIVSGRHEGLPRRRSCRRCRPGEITKNGITTAYQNSLLRAGLWALGEGDGKPEMRRMAWVALGQYIPIFAPAFMPFTLEKHRPPSAAPRSLLRACVLPGRKAFRGHYRLRSRVIVVGNVVKMTMAEYKSRVLCHAQLYKHSATGVLFILDDDDDGLPAPARVRHQQTFMP